MTSLPSSKPRPEPAEKGPLGTLLAAIVDFAGTFPPAFLDLESAVRAYHRYRQGGHAWMLGSFIVPLSEMGQLARAVGGLDRSADEAKASKWPVSVLVASLDDAARALGEGGGLPGDRFETRAIEVAPVDAEDVRPLPAAVADGVRVFHEVALDDRMEARVEAIARAGAAAKVRTGGVTREAFPSPQGLAAFVRSCAERKVPFKATSGLHHPTRGRYAVTYAPESARTDMYGFLQLALVAELLRSRRANAREAAGLLAEGGGDLEVEARELRWHGHRFSAQELAALRSDFFLSFGSCSFQEPVDDLKRMGLL